MRTWIAAVVTDSSTYHFRASLKANDPNDPEALAFGRWAMEFVENHADDETVEGVSVFDLEGLTSMTE